MAIEKKIGVRAVEDAMQKVDDTGLPGSLGVAIEQFQQKTSTLVASQITEMNIQAYIKNLISDFQTKDLSEEEREKILKKIAYAIKRGATKLEPAYKSELMKFAEENDLYEIMLLCGLEQIINCESEDPIDTIENAMQAYTLIEPEIADSIVSDLSGEKADDFLENLLDNYEFGADSQDTAEVKISGIHRIYGIYGVYLAHKGDEERAVEKFENGIAHEDYDNFKFLGDLYSKSGAFELAEGCYQEGCRRKNPLSVIGYFEYFKKRNKEQEAIKFLRANLYIIQSRSTELFYYAVGKLNELIKEEIATRRMLPNDDTLDLLIHLVHDVPLKGGEKYPMNGTEITYYSNFIKRQVSLSRDLFEKLNYLYKGGYGLDFLDFQIEFWETIYATLFTKNPEEAQNLKEFLHTTKEKREPDGLEEVYIPANLKNSLLDAECINLVGLEVEKWVRFAAIGVIPLQALDAINSVANVIGFGGNIIEAISIYQDRLEKLKNEGEEADEGRILEILESTLVESNSTFFSGAKNWVQ